MSTPATAAATSLRVLVVGPHVHSVCDFYRFGMYEELLRELGVSTLIVAADSSAQVGRSMDIEDFSRAAASLGEAAELAGSAGVRIALEFQKGSPICASRLTSLKTRPLVDALPKSRRSCQSPLK